MKYKFKLIIILILVLLSTFFIQKETNAQQDVMLTQYMSNLLPTNAAYAGTSGRLNATLLSRHQWIGFDGAPSTQVFLINSPLVKHNFGLGLTIIRDKVGPIVQTLMFADVAYNFNITEKIKLSMGLKSGVNIQKPDLSGLDLTDPSDPAFQMQQSLDFMPNFGFGLYMYSEKFYIGASTPHIMNNQYDNITVQNAEGGEERHYFFMAGYLINLNSEWKLKPSTMVKMVKGSPLSIDINMNLVYNDKIWFGALYRMQDAVGFIFQYQISQQFRFGYSYDFPITEMRKVNSGTHEIMICYDLIFKDKKIVTPRYF